MTNPFTLMYGVPSGSLILRDQEYRSIVESFDGGGYVYMYFISGIRGSGKTVLLRSLYQEFAKRDDWIVLDVNPRGDLISSICEQLSASSFSSRLLEGLTLSVRLGVLSLTKANGQKIDNPEIIAYELLQKAHRIGKKILVTVDEVTATDDFRRFINFYQSILGKGMPFYLLMTGINENIAAIINDKAMTFLTRSPRVDLGPLDLASIALSYGKELGVSESDAIAMAKLTKGYAFAYQVLGYLCFEKEKRVLDDNLKKEFELYLWGKGYAKFWNDLSENEKMFSIALAKSKNGAKEEILQNGFPANGFSQYRSRLIERGIVMSAGYGKLSFTLPCFDHYALYRKELE